MSLAVGFFIGLSFAVSMYSLQRKLVERHETSSSVVQNTKVVAALVAEIIWIGVATFCGLATTSNILRFVH